MLDNLRPTEKFVSLKVPTRVDSFNFAEFQARVEEAAAKDSPILLDLSTTQFLNFPAIKLVEKIARRRVSSSLGVLLYGASEKLKQQIRVFASFEGIKAISTYEWRERSGDPTHQA